MPFSPEAVALCQQLKKLQEAATAVCELLVTQQSILQASEGGSSQNAADAQVQQLRMLLSLSSLPFCSKLLCHYAVFKLLYGHEV